MTFGEVTKRELLSQPESWEALLTRLERAPPTLELGGYDEVVVFGSGSSYYLALAVGDLIESATGVRARVLPSCDVFLRRERYLDPYRDRRRLGLGISRSGESTEAVLAAEALRAQGVPLAVLGCTEASSLMKLADTPLFVPEGHEDGFVMLRSFTSMLLTVQALLGGVERFRGLPAAGQRLLETVYNPLKALAHGTDFRRFVFLGSGVLYPLALESALKVQEMAIATSEAYHGLEYRHGPKATAGQDTLVVLFAQGDGDYDLDLIRDLKAYGVGALVIGEDVGAFEELADLTLEFGSGLEPDDRLALSLLPVHVVAFETALRLGQNPDAPRNLSQVVRF